MSVRQPTTKIIIQPIEPVKRYEQVLARAQRDVDGATAKGYDKVKADHEADYKNIYDRVKLNLGQTKPDLANDDLLAAYNASNSTLTERRKTVLRTAAVPVRPLFADFFFPVKTPKDETIRTCRQTCRVYGAFMTEQWAMFHGALTTI